MQSNPPLNHFVHQCATDSHIKYSYISRQDPEGAPRLALDMMAAEGEGDEWKLGSGNKAEAAATATKRAEKESARCGWKMRDVDQHNALENKNMANPLDMIKCRCQLFAINL